MTKEVAEEEVVAVEAAEVMMTDVKVDMTGEMTEEATMIMVAEVGIINPLYGN